MFGHPETINAIDANYLFLYGTEESLILETLAVSSIKSSRTLRLATPSAPEKIRT